MKRTVFPMILISLLVLSGAADAKEVLTPDLQAKMAQSSPEELIPIFITMEKQAAFSDLQNMVLGKTRAERRELVVSELKRVASESQAELLLYLTEKETQGLARDLRSLWIVNVVSVKTTKEAIETIAGMKGVDTIVWERVVNLLLEDSEGSSATSIGEPIANAIPVEPNITKINAPDVWEQGYTGKCIIVGVLDTGVNYNHADLADHMWVDPEGTYPLHGYDFSNGDNNPIDDHGHGTHVSGTVAGDGTAGRAVGVAPDAEIMAIKVLDENGSADPGFTNVWAGVQFGVDEGADILSLSLGRKNPSDIIKMNSRLVFTSALAAGVISAVAAGNERDDPGPPVPDNIRDPGDVPPPWLHPDQVDLQAGGVSGVVTVGATTIDDDIGYLSSFGPSEWDIVLFGFDDYPYPPGLLDPDVCAPGINITSLDAFDDTGYLSGWNGTSMATPHVSGTFALMLQKDRDLTPAELDSILEMTSVDLGPAGKDNDFGTGRIDASDAVNALLGGAIIDFLTDGVTNVFSPPDPWVQEGLLIDTICVAAGRDLFNLRFFSDPLQCTDVPCEPDDVKKIHEDLIEFVPREIAFLRAGDSVCVEVKKTIPIGQHACTYEGEVHIIAETEDPCLPKKVWDDLVLTLDVLPTVDMDVDDNHGNVSDNVMHLKGSKNETVSGTFTAVNPNDKVTNVDLPDGPGNIRIEPVSVSSTDLTKIGDPGEIIPSGNVSIDALSSLASGEAQDVEVEVTIPAAIPVNAIYTGTVTVTYDECVHANRPDRHILGSGPISDEFTLSVEVLPTQGPLDIIDTSLAEEFCPPDPWTQIGQVEFSFEISALGDHRNIRVSSGGLRHDSLDKKLDDFNFFPGEIAFLAAGETREVTVIAKVPIGQHDGVYSGVFRVVSENHGEDSVSASAEICSHPDIDIEDDLGNLSANTMHLEAPREGIAYGTFTFVNPNAVENNADLVDGPGNLAVKNLTAIPSDLWFGGGGPPPKEPIPASMVSIDIYPDPSNLPSGAGGYGVVQVSIPKWALHWVPGYNFEYWGDLELRAYAAGDTVSDGFKITLRVLKAVGPGLTSGFWGEREGTANVLHWSDLSLSETGYHLYRDEVEIAYLSREEHEYVDHAASNAAHDYKLGIEVGGSEIMIGPVSVGGASAPAFFSLSQNYPNPFARSTTVRYQIATTDRVSLKVYDLSGRLVRTLEDDEKDAGFYLAEWDGKDESGRDVASGVYFYRLVSGGSSKDLKMVLLR